jgi:uncharacterized protein (UPF0276 family)
MSEWEFLARLADEADCGLLLDVNNVYVSSVNHDFDPLEYLRGVPHQRVVQMHLAGHTHCRTHIVDTHDDHVIDPVWELYRAAHELTGGVATLLEWDARIPSFEQVHAEVLKAQAVAAPSTRVGASGTDGSQTEMHKRAAPDAAAYDRDDANSVSLGPNSLGAGVPHPAHVVAAEAE